MERFAAWLRQELHRRNLNYSDAATILGVVPNSPRSWALGLNEPARRHVEALARVFDADLGMLYQLIGWLPQTNQAPGSATLHRITTKLSAYPPGVQQTAEDILDAFLAHQEKSAVDHR